MWHFIQTFLLPLLFSPPIFGFFWGGCPCCNTIASSCAQLTCSTTKFDWGYTSGSFGFITTPFNMTTSAGYAASFCASNVCTDYDSQVAQVRLVYNAATYGGYSTLIPATGCWLRCCDWVLESDAIPNSPLCGGISGSFAQIIPAYNCDDGNWYIIARFGGFAWYKSSPLGTSFTSPNFVTAINAGMTLSFFESTTSSGVQICDGTGTTLTFP